MDLGFVATSQPALTQALSTHRDQDGSYSDLMIRYATSHLPERSKSRFVADKFIRYYMHSRDLSCGIQQVGTSQVEK